MRAVVQRVLEASVTVDGKVVGAIDGPGLAGAARRHPRRRARPRWPGWPARSGTCGILRDERSASDVGAPILVVSQFTLYGDARKGRRPTWNAAAPGRGVRAASTSRCAPSSSGSAPPWRAAAFGADMQVSLVNDGPVTLVLDSPR